MSLEDDILRDMERGERWERRRRAFLAVCSAVVTLAVAAFLAYREWLIWSR